MQNVICIKELMHVFDDKIKAATSTPDDLSTLIQELFVDHRLDPPFERSIGGLQDQLALALALAVLLPHEIRDDFIEAHAQDRMTHEDIAREAGIPLPAVIDLLSKNWEITREILLRLN